MTLILIEGFDWMNSVSPYSYTGKIEDLFALYGAPFTRPQSSLDTRFGEGLSYKSIADTAELVFLQKLSNYLDRAGNGQSFDTSDVTIGFAVKFETENATFDYYISDAIIIHAKFKQMSVDTGSAPLIEFYLDATLIGSFATDLILNHWYYVEFQIVIAPVIGTIELRVDETIIDKITGNTGVTAGVDKLQKISSPWENPETFLVDDLYVVANDGIGLVGYQGDVRVLSVAPDQDGTLVELTPSSGIDNYALIQLPQTQTDLEATYVYNANTSPSITLVDQYKISPIIPEGSAILGVTSEFIFRNQLGGTSSSFYTCDFIDTNANSLQLSVQQSAGIDFLYTVTETAPSGSTWTSGDLETLTVQLNVRSG